MGRDAASTQESNTVCQMNRSAMKSANGQEETTFYSLFSVLGIQTWGEQSFLLPTPGFLNELSGLDVCVLNEDGVRFHGTSVYLYMIRIMVAESGGSFACLELHHHPLPLL